jgi:RNA polymerase sigma-70 factor (ECF subfamily)
MDSTPTEASSSRFTSRASVGPLYQPSTCSARSTHDRDARDRTLIASIARRDQTALRELHGRYHRRITEFARTFTYRSDVLEEVANDTLWAVWRYASRFKGSSKVSTWIMGITRNLSLKAIRKITRCGCNWSDAPEQQAYEPSLQSELTGWVDEALAQLPSEQRTVLEMFYRLGQSCEEIAQVLNCPINTVKSRMFHGRRKLRELLPRLAGVAQFI